MDNTLSDKNTLNILKIFFYIIFGGIFIIMDTLSILLVIGSFVFTPTLGIILALAILVSHIILLKKSMYLKKRIQSTISLHIITFIVIVLFGHFYNEPKAEKVVRSWNIEHGTNYGYLHSKVGF